MDAFKTFLTLTDFNFASFQWTGTGPNGLLQAVARQLAARECSQLPERARTQHHLAAVPIALGRD